MEPFFRKFCQKYDLPEAAGESLFARMERRCYRKGDCFVREGGRNTEFGIIGRGIWLGHYLNDGVDVSLWFAGEGEALFSTCGYIADTTSLITIEAMTDSEIYCVSKREAEAFFASAVEAANFGRRIIERQFLAQENWMLSSGSPRAEERYLTLLEENPELLRCVPLKHIASYLWITPQSLSRIRARLGRKKR